MENIHGQCPLSPWKLSTESMDLAMDSVDIVQSTRSNTTAGQCPLSTWTFYRQDYYILRTIRKYVNAIIFIYFSFRFVFSYRPSKQFFSHVGAEPRLPRYYQYFLGG